MSKDKLQVVLDMNEELANAIRRSVSEILILAVDEVEIDKNDSALYDEMLAHRIGLIPFEEGKKVQEFVEGDKPGTKNQAQISLKMKGPCTVYSGDFKGEIKPIHDKMPIVILEKDQELQLVAFARLGKGKDHAKHSPGLVHYRNVSEITVKKSEAKEALEKMKDSLITPLKGEVKVGDVYKSSADIDYVENFAEDGSVEVKPGKEIVLIIESWGQKSPKEIFSEAVKALDKNLKGFLKALK
jgi:DNA-directed RNA polymerase subunit D